MYKCLLAAASSPQVHRQVAIAPNHGEAYASLARRLQEMRLLWENTPRALAELADHMHLTKSPSAAITHLGFRAHPSLSLATHGRDTIHAKIIYRCDPYTLYTMPLANCQLDGGGPPPPGPGPAVPAAAAAEPEPAGPPSGL